MTNFSIGWLMPDTMSLHGERGNILALARCAGLVGLTHEITKIDFERESFDPFEYDALFMAPGEINEFAHVTEWLSGYRDALKEYVNSGHPLIVTGTSAGVFMDRTERTDGSTVDGLGIIHCVMKERDHVVGDDLLVKATYNGTEMEILGSEISMADIDIGSEQPFGEVLYGYGNGSAGKSVAAAGNGDDASAGSGGSAAAGNGDNASAGSDDNAGAGKSGTGKYEGVIKGNSLFTNLLGPVLVTNPWLTLEIVKVGTAVNGTRLCDVTGDDITADSIDMSLERKSFELKKKYCFTKPKK